MAKDVDLSSKEWRDLIFEGKNKEFGAYKLRQASESRHNKAFIYVLIGLVVIGLAVFGYVKYQAYAEAERAKLAAQAAQQRLAQMAAEEQEEKEEEKEMVELEEPETPPEEVVNQQKITEILIANDDEVKDEDRVKSQDELQQNTAIAGALNVDNGTDDISKITEQKVEIVQEKPKEEKKKEEVFRHVEQMPQYPGGDAELYKFISQNLNYPAMAIENNVQGKVIVQFVVQKDGSVGNVKVVRSVDRDLDNEAIRVCKKLPKFIPGKQNGQPVNVWYTLPVTFKLQQ